MSMWTAANKSVTYDQAKADSNLAKKDIVMVNVTHKRLMLRLLYPMHKNVKIFEKHLNPVMLVLIG